MCVIMTIDRVFPTLELLKLAEKENDDGAGIAWVEEGKAVHWRKGLKAEEVHEIGTSTKGPWIVHFRWASVGSNDKSLSHPFPITSKAGTHLTGSANKVLFHNGTMDEHDRLMFTALTRSRHKVPEGEWSDSRVLAYAYHHLGEGILNFIDDFQKIAVLDKWGNIDIYGYWHITKNSNLKISSPIKALEPKKEEKKANSWKETNKEAKIQEWAKKNNYAKNSEGLLRPNEYCPDGFEVNEDGVYVPKKSNIKLVESKG